ncbi:MAG TPA: GntR family transcriptional regulator [Planctomycetota bacterium]|jgi:DNA-binding LacI/PurR family transcriptional regulator
MAVARSGSSEAALLKGSPIPLYYQLAQRLKDDILSGRCPANARFHSDRDLVARYKISLLTVRQAMSELVNEGLLERRQGAGTFVSRRGPEMLRKSAAPTPRQTRALLFTGWSPATLSGWAAMYFRDIVEGIQKEAATHGLRLIFDDLNREQDPEASLAEATPAGVVALVGSGVRERVARMAARGVSVVTVNFAVPGLPSVRPDDYQGGRLAAERLLKSGHRRLVHLNSGENEVHWTEVKRAYREAIREAGLPLGAHPVLEGDRRGGTIEAGYQLARKALALRPRPNAIFAGNDLLAIGALQRLREAGIDVPRQASVIGFDDIQAAEICAPPLTTISVDRIALGRMAVRKVLAASTNTSEQLGPVRLRERESVAAPSRGGVGR